MPQWNADAFSHNALCALFNRFGISALRLSKPYHDIRRPAELERSDYAVSSNLGRTIAACRQAVVDIRSCLDWLEQQGYEQFGILGTSLGSCYAFIAAAMDPRLQVCAFNHASMSFGDVVWTGQSTRHIRAAFEPVMTQEQLNGIWACISPVSFMDLFAGRAAQGAGGACHLRPDVPQAIFARSARELSQRTASTSNRACSPAATTPPAKHPTSSWTAGSLAPSFIAPSRS